MSNILDQVRNIFSGNKSNPTNLRDLVSNISQTGFNNFSQNIKQIPTIANNFLNDQFTKVEKAPIVSPDPFSTLGNLGSKFVVGQVKNLIYNPQTQKLFPNSPLRQENGPNPYGYSGQKLNTYLKSPESINRSINMVANVGGAAPAAIGTQTVLSKLRSTTIKDAKQEILNSISMARNYQAFKPSDQMGIINDVTKTAKKIVPDIMKQDEIKSLYRKSPDEFLNVISKALEDRLYTAFHPELNIGNNVRSLKTSQEPHLSKSGELIFPGTKASTSKPTQQTFEQADNAANFAQLKAEEDKNAFQRVFAKWIGQRDAAKTKATLVASQHTNVPGNPTEIIKSIENRKLKVNPEQKTYIDNLRSTYDQLFKEAKDAGVDMNYVQDYLTHIWDKPISQIKMDYKAAKQKFGFASDRSLPTYEEGIKMGLTPKYNNPAQILNEYTRRLEEVKSNIQLFKDLKKEGLIVGGSKVSGDPNFVPINAPGFPRANYQIGNNQTVISNWYAPKEIASKINQVMTPQDYGGLGKVTGTLGKLSSGIQDVTMSGGVPSTPLNAWSFAQTTKELLSGRIKSPLVSLIRSISGESSQKFFQDNAGQIIKMQERNIPLSTNFKIENLIDSNTAKRTFGEKVGGVWNQIVNEPTFQRFMPQLQINLFNDIESSLLKSGRGEQEAADIAAQAVKNFYGVKGSDKTALSNKLMSDVTKTVFFAPKYRESMVNFWINNLKAMANPLAPENVTNTKFVIGAVLTYLTMNAINKANTGNDMWDNPTGKEDKMLVKTKDGYVGVPYLSSIATVPRYGIMMGKHALQGDFKQVGLDAKNLLSSGVRPMADILGNQDWSGNEIVPQGSTNPWGDVGLYLAGQYNHPYIKAALNTAGSNLPADVKSKLGISKNPVPLYQTLSTAAELPFRFYNNKNGQDALQTARYFDGRNQVTKAMDKETLSAWNVLHPQSSTGREVDNKTLSSQQKATLLLNNPRLQQAEELLAMAQKQRGEVVDPVWDLTPSQRKVVWASRIQLPGQKNTYDTYLSSQPWYKDFLNKQSNYYSSFTKSGDAKTSGQMSYPEPSVYVQKQMDNKNWNDSEVQAWFKARDEYNNQQLLALGLPTISSSSYSSKPKKVSLTGGKKSVPKIKISQAKIPTIKIAKMPKLTIKSPKVNTIKISKIKPRKGQKLTVKKTKTKIV